MVRPMMLQAKKPGTIIFWETSLSSVICSMVSSSQHLNAQFASVSLLPMTHTLWFLCQFQTKRSVMSQVSSWPMNKMLITRIIRLNSESMIKIRSWISEIWWRSNMATQLVVSWFAKCKIIQWYISLMRSKPLQRWSRSKKVASCSSSKYQRSSIQSCRQWTKFRRQIQIWESVLNGARLSSTVS